MSAATRSTPAAAGDRIELGRYQTANGDRLLIGQRVLGIVRVSDVPVSGRGRRYLVERELTRTAEVDALVADYLAEAADLGDCPMRASSVALALEAMR